MAVAPGQSFGNFQLVRLLGEGGFGEVYEAQNPFLQRRAAIKIMHGGMDRQPEMVRRFLNEARAASAIRHPNIIDVFDAGVTGEGEPYIVMEFLEGDSLQKVIAQQGAIPVSTVLEIARQAGSALAAAHQAGIVHRDLKPENLFLITDSSSPLGIQVKVLDFGIAKFRPGDEQGSTLKTQSGLLMGSPSYMSPEQCRDSSDVDLRSDIYSFAIIVYEMLVGAPPFASKSATDMLVMQITAEPPSLRQHLPDLPEHVEQAVMRALAKDRDKRFATVDYFVGALHGTYPLFTAQGSPHTPAPVSVRSPDQSLYSAAGFGYQKTPAPLPVGSRAGITPLPVPPGGSRAAIEPGPGALPNQTITTLSQAMGETLQPSEIMASDVELEAIRPKRWPWLLGLVGAAAAGTLFFTMRPDRSAPGAPSPAVPAVARPTSPPAPPEIRLEIRSAPPGATVFNAGDGTVLGMTPLSRSYTRSQGVLRALLRLEGYKDKAVTLELAGSSVTVVDLERAEAAAPAPKNVAPAARKAGVARKPPPTKPDEEEEWLVH